MKRLVLKLILYTGGIFSVGPYPAHAVLPPDVIMSVGTQAAGFLSFFAVLFGLVVGMLGVLFHVCGQYVKRYSVYLAFATLALALVGFQVLYVMDIRQAHDLYQERITALRQGQAQQLSDHPSPEPIEGGVECENCEFYSDSIHLYIPGERAQVISLDLNRRRDQGDQFTHYYFLDGYVLGSPLDSYTSFKSEVATVKTNDFLREYAKVASQDTSVRDQFIGVIDLGAAPLSFAVGPTTGDFLTRNVPEYTQFQSVGTATIDLGEQKVLAYYLVETALSNDYTKRIFFAGYDTITAETHQFILWDDRGSFYLIDDTDVVSGPDAYQSHTWLLHKDGQSGLTKKSFRADVVTKEDGTWVVSVPDFSRGIITVEQDVLYKAEDGRTRMLVSGTISDSDGTRSISGVLHHLLKRP